MAAERIYKITSLRSLNTEVLNKVYWLLIKIYSH